MPDVAAFGKVEETFYVKARLIGCRVGGRYAAYGEFKRIVGCLYCQVRPVGSSCGIDGAEFEIIACLGSKFIEKERVFVLGGAEIRVKDSVMKDLNR